MLLWIVKVTQSLTIYQKPLALDNMSCYYLGVKQKFCKGEKVMGIFDFFVVLERRKNMKIHTLLDLNLAIFVL